MVQQVIVNTPINSGQGDPANVAFGKVNANFTELYVPVARTAAESAAGVTPTNFGYAPGNVLRYGADPSGTNDSTTAFQNAINAIPSSGGTVYVPNATSFGGYKISAPLVIPSLNFLLRITGAGFGSTISMSGATSFDLFTWSNPGAGVVSAPGTLIDNLHLSGANLSGTGNLINTQYVSGVQIKDMYLQALPVNGNGINVVGNGATYSHDILISNVYYNTFQGNAIVFMGATSSDSILERVKGNGNQLCKYGIYFASGSAHSHVANSHPYGHLINSLYVGANTSSHWFMDCRCEQGAGDSAQLNGATFCTFTACMFTYAPANFANLLLVNASSNIFYNCTFTPFSAVSKYAINETGTSNKNVFNGVTLETGTFTASPPVVLVGPESAYRAQGTDLMMSGGGSLAAGGTLYVGSGSSTSENFVMVPMVYPGVARKLLVECSVAPGAGQTYTATVRNNSTNTAIVATISGAASFTAVGSGFIQTALNDSLSISVVASAGAATANIRATLAVNQ